jgi:hypothetical protein
MELRRAVDCARDQPLSVTSRIRESGCSRNLWHGRPALVVPHKSELHCMADVNGHLRLGGRRFNQT